MSRSSQTSIWRSEVDPAGYACNVRTQEPSLRMRLYVPLILLTLCGVLSSPLQAQPAPEAVPTTGDPEGSPPTTTDEEFDPDSDVEPEISELRAPELTMPDIELPPELPGPREEQPEIEEAGPPPSDPTADPWRAPENALSIAGYFRVRGLLWDDFGLGRDRPEDPGAFRHFLVADRNIVPEGGCGEVGRVNPDRDPNGPDSCGDSDQNQMATMRLRLSPTLSLSEEVRIHATFDIFDNLVLGSTPESETYAPVGASAEEGFTRARVPGVITDINTDTQNPPSALRNSLRDSIVVRRAWAEITNRAIGQLRFGRMGSHWGLGMFQNAGNDLDGDYSTDVDRILFATKLFGLSAFISYDFADQGLGSGTFLDLRAVPFDVTDIDDIGQISAAIAWRTDEAEAQERLQAGDYVLDIGAYFQGRSQSFASAVTEAFPTTADRLFVRRDAAIYTQDIWARFRLGTFRIELEAALTVGDVGSVWNPEDGGDYSAEAYNLLQFGFALEAEYRLPQLDNQFYIRLYTGFATGDRDMDGLSVHDQRGIAQTGDNTLSEFGFHPNYRVDLILWRHIMGRVAGAWYIKPGLGYDIIRTPQGRLFGISGDLIYSRAAFQTQTYGSDADLGVELNFAAYYRSEDGPGFLDGFYASFQYGVLFPFQGLGYLTDRGVTEVPGGNPDLQNAQTLRLILGVKY